MPDELVGALAAAATALEEAAPELNRLDGFAGDGDLGVTMTTVAQVVRDVLAVSYAKPVASLFTELGSSIARSAPSTSGTLIATGFLRAAKTMSPAGEQTSAEKSVPEEPVPAAEPAGQDITAAISGSFMAALVGVQARGKASVGDRTLVDGLDAVCASLEKSAREGRNWREALNAASSAAEAAAEATANMEPKLGRASWVPQRALGHRDAGCAMLAIVMGAAAAYSKQAGS